MKVVVTGATGFVGSSLLRRLDTVPELQVCAVARGESCRRLAVPTVTVGDIGPTTDWSQALAGADAVIHLAARVHVMRERVRDPLVEFRRVNVEGTMRLASQAANAGVRRLVYVSSAKALGETTDPGLPFTADSPLAPKDAYGISKAEAEVQLQSLAEKKRIEFVIVRPPLVYGPGVGANFRALLRWVARGVPLPFGKVSSNRRSLIAVDNLSDLLVLCALHPDAANRVFLASDGEDLSTSELLRRLAEALGKPARLIPIHAGFMEVLMRTIGAGSLADRLLGSLQLDIAKTRSLLGWTPPVSVDVALQRTARHFLDEARH